MPSGLSAAPSQSRKKLKSFYFATNDTGAVDEARSPQRHATDEKENIPAKTVGDGQVSGSSGTQSSQKTVVSESKECPQTPVPMRIPLADLIGNTEDAFNQESKALTPDDHVYWQHDPRSSDPASMGRSGKRGKKRARSSSPISASQTERSAHVPQRDSLDLQNLQQILKTPQADPAIDLWNRYADTSILKSNGEEKPSLHFSHLISSSPQTPAPGGDKDSSGLRRSISCGIDWPSSKSKRRRVDPEESFSRVRDIFAENKDAILAPEHPRVSRVSLLVEKIQESMARNARPENSGPSSSSPLPERLDQLPLSSASPQSRRTKVTFIDPPLPDVNVIESEQHTDGEILINLGQSSEFGDDELDEALMGGTDLAIIDVSSVGAQGHPGLSNSAEPSIPKSLPSSGKGCPVSNKTKIECPADPLPGDNDLHHDDEFDEDDETFLGIDLDNLTADLQPLDESKAKPQQEEALLDANQRAKPTLVETAVAEGDEFDADFDEDTWTQVEKSINIADAGMKLSKASGSQSNRVRAIKRYLVLEIAESVYRNSNGRSYPEKVLYVKVERTSQRKVILLRQTWFDTPAAEGSYIHLIGEFDLCGHCVVDDVNHMVILHPDHLLSATVVADSFICLRRAVLQDRVKATSDATKALVYGHALHEILQAAFKANRWDLEWLMLTIEEILQASFLESLYEINVSLSEAVDYLMSKMPDLKAWAAVFVAARPSNESIAQDRNGAQSLFSINKVLEVEEHVWSPMYGLKGNIDATVQVVMQDQIAASTRTLTVPFEFKTGKKDSNESHRAQTALYTLLLSDRYDLDIVYGILYYLETAKTFRIEGVRNEIRQMIIQRNFLASYVHNKLDLPPMIQKPYMCNACYAKSSCFAYHKLIDNGDGQTSALGDKFEEAVRHLKPLHADFFKKWDDLLTKEERDAMKIRRELWTMLSVERERLGRCFSRVIIEPGSAYEDNNGPKINRYCYSLVKQRPPPDFSFTESQLTIGEPVVVSDEAGHFALANGYVTKVSHSRLSVAVDRRLHNIRVKGRKFDVETNQAFRGIMEVDPSGSSFTATQKLDEEPILYRLDKDEFSNGMAGVRNNLIRMMEKDLFRARDLRELIIEGRTPVFKTPSSSRPFSRPESQQKLNEDQKRAIEKVMSAKDYALVLGMPGTGKTTTIAHIIRALVLQGKSVLLTSYTHTAVDNILLKIRDDKIRILRLGAPTKVHPEVKNFADLAGVPKKSIAELEDIYANSKVVATTCLGISHAIFNSRVFDYCIVDEASQITLPVCLGPIRMAKTFILVGDHFQLPPLVQNKEAQEGGLNISLFKMLSDNNPGSVVNLEHQYRMCEDIMLLSNTLIYSNRLKCGTATLGTRTLNLVNAEAGLSTHKHLLSPSTVACPSSCWLRYALQPKARVVFLNTDNMAAREIVHGQRITNPTEATITWHLVRSLLAAGATPSSLGVITFYRSHLSLLRHTLGRAGVEMHTADKFQGRDKEVVVLSCVRSNEMHKIRDLLKDWRRVNVALTRARSKLVIIGSKSTLGRSESDVLERMIRLLDGKRWILDLPKDADDLHAIGDGNSQLPSTGRPATAPCSQSPRKHAGPIKDGRSPLRPTQDRCPVTVSPSKWQGSSKDWQKQSNGIKKPLKTAKGGLSVERQLNKMPVTVDILNEEGWDDFVSSL